MLDMIKTVIIDDEIHAIRHLTRLIINSSKQFKVIGAYTNPIQALDEMAQNKPELIFIDIMMPGLNGLELAEQYVKKYPDTVIIILTSHKDFEFAKKSVEIGVHDYWLKNEIRPDTISGKLLQAAQAVQKMKMIRQGLEMGQISQLLNHQLSLSQLFPSSLPEKRYFFLAFQNQKENDRFSDSFFQELVIPQQISLSSFTSHRHLMWCVGQYASENLIGLERLEKLFFQQLQQHSEPLFPCLILSTCFSESEFSEQKFLAFADACENFHPDPGEKAHLLSLSQLELYRRDSKLYSQLEQQYLSDLIQKLDHCDINSAATVLYSMWNDPYLKSGNKEGISYCLNRINEICIAMAPDPTYPFPFLHFMENLSSYSKHSLQNESIQALPHIFAAWKAKINPSSQKISAITRYIQKNYAQDLKLSTLTEEFGLNGDYLRKRFKSETGMSITDYITKVRMTAAQELLETGKYRIYEIADMVGYHSSAYFSQSFYKQYGYYPTEKKRDEEL